MTKGEIVFEPRDLGLCPNCKLINSLCNRFGSRRSLTVVGTNVDDVACEAKALLEQRRQELGLGTVARQKRP